MTSPRYPFGGGVSDFAIAPPSRHGGFVVSAPSLGNGTLWSASTGGIQYTDLQTTDGGAISTVSTDDDGSLVPFLGPPGVDAAWIDFGGGSRALISAARAVSEHVADLLVDGTSAPSVALDGRYESISRGAREALGARICAWMQTEITTDLGASQIYGTIRRLRLRKTSASATTILSIDAADEEPQSTGTGDALQFVARFAQEFPEQAPRLKPLAVRLANTILMLQCRTPTLPQYGGFASSPGFQVYGALSAGQCVKGLLDAYAVWGVGQWLEAAKLAGTFITTLINPNPVYQSLYGVNVVSPGAGAAICSERITSSGQLSACGVAWDLVAVHAMYRLTEVTGDTSYQTTAAPVRDFMATALTGYYDYYATNTDAAGEAAGKVTGVVSFESTAPTKDNAWHRRGDATGSGVIESDSMEYALTSLWHMGYDVTAIRNAYDHLTSLSQHSSAGTPAFRAAYDAEGRKVCWPGYFKINPAGDGVDWAYGGYLDSQGAGELLAFKKAYYPDHYLLSLGIVRAVMEPDRGALLDENYETLWSDDPDIPGLVYAIQGVIPISVGGIGLVETTTPLNQEVTA